MKILLIVTPFKPSPWAGKIIPFGIVYLATVLDKAGYKVSVIDYQTFPMRRSHLRDDLLKEKPDIVGVSATTYSRFQAIEIINTVKKVLPYCLVIVGGPHFTVTAENALKVVNNIDVVVRGEGEKTIIELARAIEKNSDFSGIDGISYRIDNEVKHNKNRALIEDLDSLPQLNRAFLDEKLYREWVLPLNVPCKTILVARGCPYECSFCSLHDTTYRRRSPHNVLNEVEYLLNKFGISTIRFYDLTFTANKKMAVDFCDEISRRKIKFNWHCESKVDIDLDLLELMRDAGCRSLDFGVESASLKVLKMINKRISPDQAMSFAKKCHQLGIKTKAFFMVSLPGESLRDAEESFEFARKLSRYVSLFNVQATEIIPATQLEARARQTGLLAAGFSWNTPLDYRKTVVLMKSQSVPLYLENLSLSEIKKFLCRYSILEMLWVRKLSIRVLIYKPWQILANWGDIGFKLRTFLVFLFSVIKKKAIMAIIR